MAMAIESAMDSFHAANKHANAYEQIWSSMVDGRFRYVADCCHHVDERKRNLRLRFIFEWFHLKIHLKTLFKVLFNFPRVTCLRSNQSDRQFKNYIHRLQCTLKSWLTCFAVHWSMHIYLYSSSMHVLSNPTFRLIFFSAFVSWVLRTWVRILYISWVRLYRLLTKKDRRFNQNVCPRNQAVGVDIEVSGHCLLSRNRCVW